MYLHELENWWVLHICGLFPFILLMMETEE